MSFSIKIDRKTGQKYISVNTKGRSVLRNPFLNKGSAFNIRERKDLNLLGLLPACTSTIDDQLKRNYENFIDLPTNLEKFKHLQSLYDRNETLFYRFLMEHLEETVPIVYTPTVGEVCQKFSHIYQRARGVYIGYDQKDHIEEILRNYHTLKPSIIVVTDGERILGLGDQGSDGMGIPIGKLSLYTAGAGISPYSTLPILLDVGTDNDERRNDPMYLGLRQKRIRGEQYQEFIDSFVQAVSRVYGDVLLQWEDFLKANAIKQLDRFRDSLCSFNDDIQGTGSVMLAFIYKAMKGLGHPISESRVVIAGAGAASQGIAGLIVAALQESGLSAEESRKHIWMVDSRGLVSRTRKNLEPFKADYARDIDEIAEYRCKDREKITLEETVANVRPNILIGTAATPGLFNQSVIELMAEINEYPVILPVSNPISKCECLPEDAIRWSGGRAIVATGSPFDPVEYNGQTYKIGQCNNFFIFPGVGLGVTVGGIRRLTDNMFLAASKALAEQFSTGTTGPGSVSPELKNIRQYSHAVACEVIRCAVSEGHADENVLVNLEETVLRSMWYPEYMPVRYEGKTTE